MSIVYLGLGSNLGDSLHILQSALDLLNRDKKISLLKVSAFYGSKPLDNKKQPDYVNTVAQISTDYLPYDLLNQLQAVEKQFGRVRNGQHWASRTLDIDILLYDDLQLCEEKLIIPHVGMLERDFVLYPLSEIAPNVEIPGFGLLNEALKTCDNRGLEKLNDNNP